MLERSSSSSSSAISVPPLTDLVARSAEPPAEGTVTIWDTSLNGFGLRVNHGGKKTWIVLIAPGRRQAIGHYPLISLADARREARRILAEKELGKVRPRFTAFDDAKSAYLAACEEKNRPLTVRDYARHLAVHFPFARKALGDITPRDVLRQLANLPPSEKHHAFTAARAFFRWCVRQHLIDRSPMENMETPPNGKSRERVLTESELRLLWTCLCNAPQAPSRDFNAIVRLLLLTGQRRGEIARLEWNWINEAEQKITIPSSVTKNRRTHCFPYGTLIAEILTSTVRFEGCPYVFPASRVRSDKTTVFNGFSKPKAALDKTTGITGWTLHDLRRTYSSTMAALGVPQIVVEKLLNHVSGGTQSPIAQTYNRYSYLAEMREAVLKHEAYLRTLIEPTA